MKDRGQDIKLKCASDMWQTFLTRRTSIQAHDEAKPFPDKLLHVQASPRRSYGFTRLPLRQCAHHIPIPIPTPLYRSTHDMWQKFLTCRTSIQTHDEAKPFPDKKLQMQASPHRSDGFPFMMEFLPGRDGHGAWVFSNILLSSPD